MHAWPSLSSFISTQLEEISNIFTRPYIVKKNEDDEWYFGGDIVAGELTRALCNKVNISRRS